MRHKKESARLGRSKSHMKVLLSSLVCNLIEEKKIVTTHKKAKLARVLAEKMVTLAKQNDLPARRQAIARLRRPERVAVLFSEIAPQFADRKGGYTRITKMGRRASDSSEMAVLEWVGIAAKDKRKKKKAEKTDDKKAVDAKQEEQSAKK